MRPPEIKMSKILLLTPDKSRVTPAVSIRKDVRVHLTSLTRHRRPKRIFRVNIFYSVIIHDEPIQITNV